MTFKGGLWSFLTQSIIKAAIAVKINVDFWPMDLEAIICKILSL